MRLLLSAAAMLAALTVPASAQEPPALALELNALTPSETGCRITFLAANRLGTELSGAGLEVALFGADGGIDRLLALDFKALPEGKTRVLQFDIPAMECGSITRVLINDVTACDGDGLTPAACLAGLELTTRLDVGFGI